jgi:tetratricopeptide (TPR) repeat protein
VKTLKNKWIDRVLIVTSVAFLFFGIKQYWMQRSEKAPATVQGNPSTVLDEPMSEKFSLAEQETLNRIKVLFNTADYEGVLKIVEALLSENDLSVDFREWLQRQMGPILASQAWVKLNLGECDDAIRILYRANKYFPTPEAKKGLGVCLHAAKNWPEAASWFANYLLERPDDVLARVLYSDSLESLGRHDEAIVILDGALKVESITPQDAEMVSGKLQAMKTKAKEGVRQKSEHSRRFSITYTEDLHDSLLPLVVETLESALDEYIDVLAVIPPTNTFEVVLYRQEAFQELIPGGPEWSEGLFDGRVRVPIREFKEQQGKLEQRDLLKLILRHELSHAVLSRHLKNQNLPPWFDEGLAQYLSCRKLNCDRYDFKPTPGDFSEEKFLSESYFTLSNIDAGRAYSHSLYLVRLMVRQKGEGVLRIVGSDLSQSQAITSDLLANAFGYGKFDDLLRTARDLYQRGWSP